MIHNAGAKSEEDIVEWAKNCLEEFCKVDKDNLEKIKGMGQRIMKEIRWERPREGMFKVNTDATICSERNLVGFGIVIHNYDGEVMGYSSQIAEAYVIFLGILFAKDTGVLPTVIEFNAKTVVDLINAEIPPSVEIGIVISDIISFCKLYDIRVVFALRSANVFHIT
ncbi:hypothetical protein Ddye_022945 [Dipteronia dyeriana]|uniref:RNase H type-1 domain-containing protein n=1 Tax=Dipteronia dyeriana TaxID=168575 RepID=A0AAD9TS18_9ROSI|nr:hypothetical protein Ddye_022945 [Dipteronia dyeriana]